MYPRSNSNIIISLYGKVRKTVEKSILGFIKKYQTEDKEKPEGSKESSKETER